MNAILHKKTRIPILNWEWRVSLFFFLCTCEKNEKIKSQWTIALHDCILQNVRIPAAYRNTKLNKWSFHFDFIKQSKDQSDFAIIKKRTNLSVFFIYRSREVTSVNQAFVNFHENYQRQFWYLCYHCLSPIWKKMSFIQNILINSYISNC